MGQDASGNPAPKKPRSRTLPPPPPQVLADALGIQTITIEWLAGDGSDRCYYRLSAPELPASLVLMQLSGTDAQALRDDGYDWINIAKILAERGIFVPRVIATLPAHAALVIEDYGDVMLEGSIFALAERNDFAAIRRLYQQCAEIIAGFLAIPRQAAAPWCKRSFDEERFVWELHFFLQKYVSGVAGIELSKAELKVFSDEAGRLGQTLAANSKYFVHRDFHSRNVMVKGDDLAIIDFQDARLGPAAYDIVSLCFDSYVPFTAATRSQLLQDALGVAKAKLPASVHDDIATLWKPSLLQRQLKAIGSFGYLTVDKERGDYLKYVEPALRTLEEQDIGDPRWPFLSIELIGRLRSYLTAKKDQAQ